MDITFIGHASILVRAGGLSVLSDPWWRGPCFGAQWWPYPTPYTEPVLREPPDYVYLSHGHHDHFHAATLGTLPRTTKVLVSSRVGLAWAVRELGFEVIEVEPDEEVALGDGSVRCRIIPTDGDDTLMAISHGGQTCLNLNDALHSAAPAVQTRIIGELRRLYPELTYVFCGYGVASHFPNCYRIPGKDDNATAARRQRHFNEEWARLVAALRPRFAFPFAADVVLLQEELLWVNEATHNASRPTEVFAARHPKSPTRVHDVAPGFRIADGRVLAEVLRGPISAAQLRTELADKVARANRVGRADESLVHDATEALRRNLDHCRDYLAGHPDDYTVALRFHESPLCLLLSKRGRQLTLDSVAEDRLPAVDLTYTTRWAYLRWALTRPFGDELLFVGSGGTFEYATRDAARNGLHLELIRLIRNQATGQREPGAASLSPLRRVRRALRNLLGPRAPDLYDLMAWTVFEPEGAERPQPVQRERRAPAHAGRPSAAQRGPRVANVAAAKAR